MPMRVRCRLAPRADDAAAMRSLRHYRQREALRLIWRDVNAFDRVADTLAGSSALAETCLAARPGLRGKPIRATSRRSA